MKCAAAMCEREARRAGLCLPHYKRRLAGKPVDVPLRARRQGRDIREYRQHTKLGDRRLVHVVMAERALGRPLPEGAQVHHVNGIRGDNRPENLVICPSQAYHHLLHVRTRALDACGNANYRMCVVCKNHDDPLHMRSNCIGVYYHAECSRAEARARRAKKRELVSITERTQ